MKRIINYIWPVLLCFGIGFAASKLQAESMMEWYPHLNKSGLTPPNIAFPIMVYNISPDGTFIGTGVEQGI